MRVLIIGSDGMLGHILSKYLQTNSEHKVFNLSRNIRIKADNHFSCDISDEKLLIKICKKVNPDIIINCVGILIKGSNNSIKNAIYVNSYFPHFLVEISNKLNFKVIHISTDCVFSGSTGSYSEDSIKDAKDTYGLTKSLGEINSSRHLTIRTSIIGPELKTNGEGLFNWLFKQDGEISGYSRVIWSGITTLELAKVILFSIHNDIYGLWNVSSPDPISKYELLIKIKNQFSLTNIRINNNAKLSLDKSLISKRKINYIVPSYDIMINELFDYIHLNKQLYNSYLNESKRT